MSYLSASQWLVLSTAAGRPDGSVLPLPEGLAVRGRARQLMLDGLKKRGLIAERAAQEGEPVRSERDGDQSLALEITPEGRARIGSRDEEPFDRGDQPVDPATPRDPGSNAASTGAPTVRPGTKQALLVDLLRRPDGATIAEIQDATGWLPHSARAALTGLRKKSFAVTSARRGDGTRAYRLPAEDTGEDEGTS